jgi:hypothetical protein
MADMRQMACVKSAGPTSTKTSNATTAEATHAATAEAAHVTTTEATAHVASSAAAASGLCTRGQKAAGKHRACQDHHHSSSHDILH